MGGFVAMRWGIVCVMLCWVSVMVSRFRYILFGSVTISQAISMAMCCDALRPGMLLGHPLGLIGPCCECCRAAKLLLSPKCPTFEGCHGCLLALLRSANFRAAVKQVSMS